MQDRISTYPGRVTLVPVSGQENTYTLTRADDPTQVGTPLNKQTLLSDETVAAIAAASGTTPETPSEALALVLQNASYDPNNIVATAAGAYNVQIASNTNRSFTFPWSAVLGKMPKHVRLEIYASYNASRDQEAYSPYLQVDTNRVPAVVDMWYNATDNRFDGIVKAYDYAQSGRMFVDVVKGGVDKGSQSSSGSVSKALFSCQISSDGSYITGLGGALFFPISTGYGASYGYGYGFQFNQTGVTFTVAFRGTGSADSQYTMFSVNAYAYG